MSVFNDAMAAIEAAKKAQEKADAAYEAAGAEWELLQEARGPKMDKERLNSLMELVKKYAPTALKYFGMGTGGLAIGGLLENSSILSNLFSFLPF